MKKKIFAVCDLEKAYAYNLMEYIQSRQGGEFEVQAFTNVRTLCQYAAKQPLELLLISVQAMCREVSGLSISRILILSEGELLQELSEYPSIYKYQACDSLIAEVMNYYAAETATAPKAKLKRRVELIGVYTPVKRTSKTSFALALGQNLAQSKAVLYVNLEDYAGFEGLLGKKFPADISDLIYFMKQKQGNLIYQLEGMLQTINNLDFIPPPFLPGDLHCVTLEEWKRLLDDLTTYSNYEIILIDLDEQTGCLLDLLKLCGRIYMPVLEDSISIARLEQFEEILRSQSQAILTKIRKLKLPFHSSFGPKEQYMEQLIWGELGDYVRKLVREEEGDGKYRIQHPGT